MRIEIGPTLQTDDENTRMQISRMVDSIVSAAVEFVKPETDDLEAIIITDDQNFGRVIEQLQSGSGLNPGYTDNDIHVAGAKTIPRRDGQRITSTIVYRDNLMAEMLGDLSRESDLSEWGQDSQFCFYLLAHEMGHSKDNRIRGLVENCERSFKGEFRVRKVADFYWTIVLSELAACVHSGSAASPTVFRNEIRQWQEDSTAYLNTVKSSWQQYHHQTKSLNLLAYDAAQGFWVILVQYAKLIGMQIGNANLESLEPSEGLSTGTAAILKSTKKFLKLLWNEYPKWSGELNPSMMKIWQDLAAHYGYRFSEKGQHDALYLNNLSICITTHF